MSVCPPFLTAADDLPHAIVDEPLWSENYLSHAVFTGQVLSHVTVDDGQGRIPGRIISEAPLIADLADGTTDYTLVFETGRGTVRIMGEPGQTATLSMAGTSELVIGRDPEPTASHWLAEATTQFTWDGAQGWGLTERTVRRHQEEQT